MSPLDTFLASILERAIAELKNARADVYTFSFCHEQSSGAVCVYADSEESSRRVVGALNRASMKRFAKAVKKRDLEEAMMWQATVGRSLSLRNFAWKKLAKSSLRKLESAEALHEAMLLAAMNVVPKVAALSSDPEALLFTCSTVDEEVGLVWTADAATKARATRKRR
ncbi:MAG TPA: hypothetical protein VFN67_06740 [Polyangiales bacterium]|nr:hypothetical protein [Polyangiales bacterium]